MVGVRLSYAKGKGWVMIRARIRVGVSVKIGLLSVEGMGREEKTR